MIHWNFPECGPQGTVLPPPSLEGKALSIQKFRTRLNRPDMLAMQPCHPCHPCYPLRDEAPKLQFQRPAFGFLLGMPNNMVSITIDDPNDSLSPWPRQLRLIKHRKSSCLGCEQVLTMSAYYCCTGCREGNGHLQGCAAVQPAAEKMNSLGRNGPTCHVVEPMIGPTEGACAHPDCNFLVCGVDEQFCCKKCRSQWDEGQPLGLLGTTNVL